MTTAAPEMEQRASAESGGNRPTDVLVVFGITGDLAKVMTFLSLYRLERRGLLDCPVGGVAGDDWAARRRRGRRRGGRPPQGAGTHVDRAGRQGARRRAGLRAAREPPELRERQLRRS